MGFSAQILLDSLSPAGARLTTMQVSFPRFVLAEFNTHRVFSRNSASSRAIPTEKLIARIIEDPVYPVEWGLNQRGMSAQEVLTPEDERRARDVWDAAMSNAIAAVREMQLYHVHKQIINRILEPFMWHTVIVTSTEWGNFFALRCASNAQPEIRVAAERMRDAYNASEPHRLEVGQWHLPFVQHDERTFDLQIQKKVSAARCARVSYLTHEGKRDIEKDDTRINWKKNTFPFRK